MSNQPPQHIFAPASSLAPLPIPAHELSVRQQPVHGRAWLGKEKDRKPIDPPPMVELKVQQDVDPYREFLASPFYFCKATLLNVKGEHIHTVDLAGILGGTTVSSLHKLKDTNNQEGGFFIFGDLSVKVDGDYRLQFSTYEIRGTEAVYIAKTVSEPFRVYTHKSWPGMDESTYLTRLFSDQGVRLRLRKEPRMRLNPQGPSSDNYQPRKYSARRRTSGALSSVSHLTPIISPKSDPVGQQSAEPEGQQQDAQGSYNQPQEQLVRDQSSSTHQSPMPGLPGDERMAKRSRTHELEYRSNSEILSPFSAAPPGPPAGPQQIDRSFQQPYEQPYMPQFDGAADPQQFTPNQPPPQLRQSMSYMQYRNQQLGFEQPDPRRNQSDGMYNPQQYQRPSPDNMGFQYNMPVQPPMQQSYLPQQPGFPPDMQQPMMREPPTYASDMQQPGMRSMSQLYTPSPGPGPSMYGGQEPAIDPMLMATSQMPPPPQQQQQQQQQQQFYGSLDPQLMTGEAPGMEGGMDLTMSGLGFRSSVSANPGYVMESRMSSLGPNEGVGFRSTPAYDLQQRHLQQPGTPEVPPHLQG